jgi:peptidoglycan/LPS O-acetylase OafA/YrhL
MMVHAPGAPYWSNATYAWQPTLMRTIEDGLWRVFLKDDTGAYNPVMWTMKVEFLGSLLTFGLALVTADMQFRPLIYALCCTTLLATVKDGVYYCLFIAGICFSDVPLRSLKRLAAILLLAVAIWLGGYREGSTVHVPLNFLHITLDDITTDSFHLCNAISGAIIVLVALTWESFTSFLPRFKELGRRSFSPYLIHFPILGSLGVGLYLKIKAWGYGESVASVAASIVVGIVAYVASGWYATWIHEWSVRASKIARRIMMNNTNPQGHAAIITK